MVVVSNGFDRAVVRDAVMEQCTLLPVALLSEILQINSVCAISPFELEPILKKENLVSSEDCRQLKEQADASRKMVESVIRVITALDFKSRALKEIEGRLDYEDEAELADILSLLSSPLLSIIVKADGNYSSRYSHAQSIERLKQLFSVLIWPSRKE